MTKLVLIQAVTGAVGGAFYRLGRRFTEAGSIHDWSEFSEKEQAVLQETSMLRIGPAPEGATLAASNDALRDAIKAVLTKLDAADFGEGGQPKLAAVRKALPPGTKNVTAEVVAEVWAELKPAS